MVNKIETLSTEIGWLTDTAKNIETQIKGLQRQLLAMNGEIMEKRGELAELVVAEKSFSSTATVVRTLFVTPHHGADIAKLVIELQGLGAIAFEPARKLAAKGAWSEWTGPFAMPTNIIFRVDFGNDVSRRMVERVRGITKVRATLEFAPRGTDLPAAGRPIPPLSRSRKTPPTPGSMNSLRKAERRERKAAKATLSA